MLSWAKLGTLLEQGISKYRAQVDISPLTLQQIHGCIFGGARLKVYKVQEQIRDAAPPNPQPGMAGAYRWGCSFTGTFHPALEGSGYSLAGSFIVLPGIFAESDSSFCLEICWVSTNMCRGKCKFGKLKCARKLFPKQPASYSPCLVCSC